MSASRPKSPRILVAPLDWGLGHATRCIPLIRELLHLGCEVLLGAEGMQAALLRQEFPQLPVLPLRGYRITYARNGRGFGIKMLRQLPRLWRAVVDERRWLKEMAAVHGLDAVISDNRLGLFHDEIPCVILTHQLRIKSPFPLMDRWLQKVHYFFINKFSECWVVDFEGPENLAGALSHPRLKPRRLKYIGALSRFERREAATLRYDLLVLVSGPEPQRSRFEERVLTQLRDTTLNALMVSGRPGEPCDRMLTATVRQVNHLEAGTLNEALLASALVLSRSGYTTVMDLVKLGKKAVLVPTPGQTEQEYLGRFLMQQGYFYAAPQEGFQLLQALEDSRKRSCEPPLLQNMEQYKSILATFVAECRRGARRNNE